MALNLTITDPTDPGVSVNAYVRLVLCNKPRKGLNLGLHAEFLVYRSKAAANAGGAPISGQSLVLDIPSSIYDKVYDYLFSSEALSKLNWNPDAVVYQYASEFGQNFAQAVPDLDSGQAALDLGLPADLVTDIQQYNNPQQQQQP